MPNLRLLPFASNIRYGEKRVDYTLSLPTNLELRNNLRYIQWDGCPLKSLSNTSWPSKLVELSMPYSNAEKLWDEPQRLLLVIRHLHHFSFLILLALLCFLSVSSTHFHTTSHSDHEFEHGAMSVESVEIENSRASSIARIVRIDSLVRKLINGS
ncbi:hypothetical protein PIB30_044036 [Stylosanthes scabra]|uniref:Uncharacterized protein n=1 Tax=Stylosanthes scabra TaxID=79078 RepID=A0ABU6QFW8_9FABA|nr:hypothetical protein [Stylosanthes scabra]